MQHKLLLPDQPPRAADEAGATRPIAARLQPGFITDRRCRSPEAAADRDGDFPGVTVGNV
jgi:hypothetical protein